MLENHSDYKTSGFTIAELLVVIVVIAILGTISFINYSGVQKKASASAAVALVDQWDRLLQAEAAISGGLPATPTTGPLCLGRTAADFPAENGFASGECFKSIGTSPASYIFSEEYVGQLTNTPNPIAGAYPLTILQYPTNNMMISRGVRLAVYPVNRSYSFNWVTQVAGHCGRGISAYAPHGLGSDLGGTCFLQRHY